MADNRFSNAPPAKGYKYVRVADFAHYDDNGKLAALFCKLCGQIMGEVVPKVINRRTTDDGRIIEQVETRFRRNQHFGQLSIELERGARHETALCRKCCAGNLKPAILEELVRADAVEQRWADPALEDRVGMKAKGMLRMDLRKMQGAE